MIFTIYGNYASSKKTCSRALQKHSRSELYSNVNKALRILFVATAGNKVPSIKMIYGSGKVNKTLAQTFA
jgi:hypothetical protein